MRRFIAQRRYADMKQTAKKCEEDMQQLNNIVTQLADYLKPQQKKLQDEDAEHQEEKVRAEKIKQEEEKRKAEEKRQEEERRRAEENRELEDKKIAEEHNEQVNKTV